MNPLKATMMQAVSGMQVQSQRIGVTSENISNADTPGYQRKVLTVEEGSGADQFQSVRVSLPSAQRVTISRVPFSRAA